MSVFHNRPQIATGLGKRRPGSLSSPARLRIVSTLSPALQGPQSTQLTTETGVDTHFVVHGFKCRHISIMI